MTSRLAQRRRRRAILIASGVGVFVVVIFALVLWISNASFLKITNISVTGETVIPESSIQAAVSDAMAGRYAGLFSKSNILLYPRDTIEKDLTTLYPTLMSARIRANNFHTIAVTVTERSPHALWCSSDTASSSQSCVLLDENGLAYAHAPEYSGQVYQKYSQDPLPSSLPQQFLTSQEFHSLSALVDAFSKKLAPETLTAIAIDANRDVHLETSGGYEILFGLGDDSGDVFQHFSLILTSGPFTTHALSQFQYIDLRFGDKVYYKLKN